MEAIEEAFIFGGVMGKERRGVKGQGQKDIWDVEPGWEKGNHGEKGIAWYGGCIYCDAI